MIEEYILARFTINVYLSDSFDPGINLSFEEYLMSECNENTVIMFLWQNKKTVVIGRNQNPMQECQLSNLAKDGVQLVRRQSGGGAVYHDIGNLNFTFIAHTMHYDLNKQLNVILDAITAFDINGKFTGRNDLTIDGKKFSGNAFIHDDDFHCHHGTIMVDVELEKLVRYLTPTKIKITSKGIDSVKSRVVNLINCNSAISIESLKKTLITSFDKNYESKSSVTLLTQQDHHLISLYKDKYYSPEWNINESPKCDISHERKFNWGVIELSMSIKNGAIENCSINTDSIIVDNFQCLQTNFIGSQLINIQLNSIIENSIKNQTIRNDLKLLINDFNLSNHS
jgi:lipoate-protein ligase A